MERDAEDGRVEAKASEGRSPDVAPEEARGAGRKDADEAEWMFMATGDPALFIKDDE